MVVRGGGGLDEMIGSTGSAKSSTSSASKPSKWRFSAAETGERWWRRRERMEKRAIR